MLLYTVLGIIDGVLMARSARHWLGPGDEGRPTQQEQDRSGQSANDLVLGGAGYVRAGSKPEHRLVRAARVLWAGCFVLEGFDFGVGMLSLVLGRDDIDRRMARNAIGPWWDGNEVWVIVAAGGTFAAFPLWYATMFSAFYFVLLLILAALIGRAWPSSSAASGTARGGAMAGTP